MVFELLTIEFSSYLK